MARRNLVPNPSFETGLTGWTTNGNALGREQSPFTPQAGSWYAFGNRPNTALLFIYQGATGGQSVTGGQSYAASIYVNRDGGNGLDFGIDWFNSAGTLLTNPRVSLNPASGTWTRASFVETAPATAVRGSLWINFINQGAGQYFRVDAAMLEQATVVGPYGDGSTDGWAWDGTPHASSSTKLPLQAAATAVSGVVASAAPRLVAATGGVSTSGVTASLFTGLAGGLSLDVVSGTPAALGTLWSTEITDLSVVSGTQVSAAAQVQTRIVAESVSGTVSDATASIEQFLDPSVVSGTISAADAAKTIDLTVVSGTRVGLAPEGSIGSIVSGSVSELATVWDVSLTAEAVSGSVVDAGAALTGTPDLTPSVSGTVSGLAETLLDRGAPLLPSVSGTPVSPLAVMHTALNGATSVSGTVAALKAFNVSDTDTGAVSGTVAKLAATLIHPAFRVPDGPVKPQVALPRVRLLVADTITGKLHFELPYSALTWNSPLNDIGSAAATLPVEASLDALSSQGANDPRAALRAVLLGPYRWSLVIAFGDVALWGGPYLPSEDVSDGVIAIGAKGMERMLERRILVNADPAIEAKLSDATRDIVVPQSTPAGAVYSVVERAVDTYSGLAPSRALPIVCTATPQLLGDETFTYLAYDVATAWKAITDLAGRDDGPDVRLEPVLVDGDDGTYCNWDLQIGEPYLPASGNSGPDGPLPWTFDDTSAVLKRTVDAVGLSSSWWGTGDGQDREKKITRSSTSSLTDLGFPALETVDAGSSSQTEMEKLEAATRASLAAHQTPTDSWSLDVPIDGPVPLGEVRRGEMARLDITRALLISPGYYPRRITDVAGDAVAATYTLTCDEPEEGLVESDPIPASDGRPEVYVPPDRPAPSSVKVTDLIGSGFTDAYSVGGADLGMPALTPDGSRILAIFGDSYESAGPMTGIGWRSPIGLYAAASGWENGLDWVGAAGTTGDTPKYAGQLVPYVHNSTILYNGVPYFITTQLPSDVISIGATMYMQVMACEGLGNVHWTEIYQSTNQGNTWTSTGTRWDGSYLNGMFQSLTWERGSDGYVYCLSTGFQRDKGLILSRVPEGQLTTKASWQTWGFAGGVWAWGNPPTEVLAGAYGEMSLRKIGAKWVVVGFDEAHYRIDARVVDSPTADLTVAPMKTLVTGGAWGSEDHSRGIVAQLYGGFPIPGSTLANFHFIISQWNTTSGYPYRSMQFKGDLSSLAT